MPGATCASSAPEAPSEEGFRSRNVQLAAEGAECAAREVGGSYRNTGGKVKETRALPLLRPSARSGSLACMPAPLLLLPGLLCDEALWDHQLRHLADLGPMSVADLTRDDTLGAMAERVLEAAPPRFDLAGLSMGGYVAFEILRRAPERVGRLCLIDTSARPDTEEQAARRRGLMELAGRGQFKGVTPRLLPLLVHPDRLADAPLTGTVMAMADRVGAEAFLQQQRAILGRPDSRPGLARSGRRRS